MPFMTLAERVALRILKEFPTPETLAIAKRALDILTEESMAKVKDAEDALKDSFPTGTVAW